MHKYKPTLLFLLNALIVGHGCGEERIHKYQVAKDPAEPVAEDPHAGHDHAAPAAKLTWTLPDGWEQQPASGMRFATLLMPVENGDPLEVRVTPLAMAAGDILGNVNRWAVQIDLPQVTEADLPKVTKHIHDNDLHITLVDLEGPQQRTLAAMFTHAGRVWFFAVTGAVDQVSPQRDAFEAMVRSIRVEASAPAPAPAADAVVTAPTSTTGSGFTWQKPAAWRDDPNASSMRVASFIISDGDMQGEVAVTRFPGDVGGLLSNINRWRGQVGLAPIQTIEDQPIQEVKVADLSSALLDLIESDVEDPTEARRMVVAIVPQGGMTWFFKMTGPSALLEKKAAAYNAFLHSIHQADE